MLFHAVQKPGDVRIARNHALADAAAKQAVRLRAAKDAQNVVLRGGKPGGFDELLGFLGEGIGGLQDGNKDVVFAGSWGEWNAKS